MRMLTQTLSSTTSIQKPLKSRRRMHLNSESGDRKSDNDHGENKRHNFHVLAVDDSHIDRMLLERLLTVSSCQVTCVESGYKALEYLGLQNTEFERSLSSTSSACSANSPQVSKINLIITDYSMPGITGYDLLKRVKDSSWKDIPVVIVSSENVPSRINMCLEGGAEEFLLKPVKLSDVTKIYSHLNSKCHHTNTSEYYNSMCSTEKTKKNTHKDEQDRNSITNPNKRKVTS